MDASTIQQGNASTEPPRQEGCPAPRALTLQYSSMGFSLFTATSRTWLLRNRILPKERTHERGGLGASPAMWDCTAAPSRQVSRVSSLAPTMAVSMKPGRLPPQSCLCELLERGHRDSWDRGGVLISSCRSHKRFWFLCSDGIILEWTDTMLWLAPNSGSLWHVRAGCAGSITGLQLLPTLLPPTVDAPAPSRQTNHTPSSPANTRLLVTEPL